MAFDPAAASKSTVILFAGDDSVSRGRALEDVLREANADKSETEQFQAETCQPQDWLGAALTVPFFADRRTFIIRNIGRLDPTKVWDEPIGAKHPGVRALKELPETSLVLLVADDELGDEDRQRRLATCVGHWSKIVTAAGGKVGSFQVDPSKTAELIREDAAKFGKKISPKAVTTLTMLVSSKPSLATSELAKAALYSGDAPEISERDVLTAVTPDLEYNVFKLLDAIIAGQSGEAVRQMRTLFGQTTNLMEQALSRVFPVFLNQFRQIWQARFCLDSGTNPAKPSAEVELWLGSKKLSSEPDWRQRKAVGAARRLSLDQIGACIKALSDAEAELKGQKASFSADETLERMTLSMCSVCSMASATS